MGRVFFCLAPSPRYRLTRHGTTDCLVLTSKTSRYLNYTDFAAIECVTGHRQSRTDTKWAIFSKKYIINYPSVLFDTS